MYGFLSSPMSSVSFFALVERRYLAPTLRRATRTGYADGSRPESTSWTSMSAVSILTPITRANRRTIACDPLLGACCSWSRRFFSIAPAWSAMKRRRARSQPSSASVFGGSGTPSGVRNYSSRSGAFRSFGLKLQMPRRIEAPFSRLMMRLFTSTLTAQTVCRCRARCEVGQGDRTS